MIRLRALILEATVFVVAFYIALRDARSIPAPPPSLEDDDAGPLLDGLGIAAINVPVERTHRCYSRPS